MFNHYKSRVVMGDNYDTEWIHLNNDLQNEYNEPSINFKQGGYAISMG